MKKHLLRYVAASWQPYNFKSGAGAGQGGGHRILLPNKGFLDQKSYCRSRRNRGSNLAAGRHPAPHREDGRRGGATINHVRQKGYKKVSEFKSRPNKKSSRREGRLGISKTANTRRLPVANGRQPLTTKPNTR